MQLSTIAGVTLALGLAAAGWSDLARGADPVRGFALFQSENHGPCGSCHGNPKNNRFNILKGANNPAVIAAAAKKIRAPIPPQDELDDLAAYLGTYVTGPAVAAPAEPVEVIEYFHKSFNHYFVTVLAAEIAALDSGAQTGWTRTGKKFFAWKSAADAPASASPVCRFYIPPANGDSHFYSASPAECATVDAQFPAFDYEAADVMYVLLPDPGTGVCPGLAAPVFRLWNDPSSRGRTDNNHRFTTDTKTQQQMVAAGSVPEGVGALGVSMCAPIPSLGF